jgi:endogenous inhibitor of DNA gyrase (YacG/DUF329 family)
MGKCPICKKTASPRAENAAFPFCGTRCKQVDLGQWLNEAYRVPASDSGVAADDGEGDDGTKREVS